MNQKSAKLLRRFIKKGNPNLDITETKKLIRKSYKRYNTLTAQEKEEFKKRIK